MLTIFTTAKPFRGHIGVIQRNALKSWTLLHRDVEIILFGDDEGAAEAAREFGLRHEPQVERNDTGMKRLDYIFGEARAIARHDVLCYVNCDIILMADFRTALEQVRKKYSRFLMVGRRWDTPVTDAIDYSDPAWAEKIRAFALSTNHQRNRWFIDYFAFERDTYGDDLLPFVIGTVRWDNWLIWKALDRRLPVVDASPVVIAIHQNHDYSYHAQGRKGVWEGKEAQRNHELAGGWRHLRTIADTTLVLRPSGFTTNPKRYWFALRRRTDTALSAAYFRVWHPVWFFFLDISRPVRNVLGLRSRAVRQKS